MTQRSTAQTDATTVRDETAAGANTATRVGTAIKELADNCVFNEDVSATSSANIIPKANGSGVLAAGFIPALNLVPQPTADVAMNSHKITGMTPGAATGEGVAYETLLALPGITKATVANA